MAAAKVKSRASPRDASPLDADMGGKIRKRRLEIGMSQTTLGESLGVSFQQIQKYEKGTNRASAGRLAAIAKVLDVSMDYFYGKTKPMKHKPSFNDLDPMAERALRAYARIESQQLRRQLVHLAEALAGEGR